MMWAAVTGGLLAVLFLVWPWLDQRRHQRDADWHEQWKRRG